MDVKSQETVCTVPISLIDDFAEHPFQVRDDEDMERLIQSIENNGILNPVIMRKNGDRYYGTQIRCRQGSFQRSARGWL